MARFNLRNIILCLSSALLVTTTSCAVLAGEPKISSQDHGKTILLDPKCYGGQEPSEAEQSTLADIKVESVEELHQIDIENAEGLDITNVPISDIDLAVLKKCKKLRRLYLSGTKITNKGMLSVNLPQLEKLSVGTDHFDDAETVVVDDGGFVDQSRFPALQELNITHKAPLRTSLVNISKLALKRLQIYRWPSIEETERDIYDPDHLDISDLGNCSTLKVLEIPGKTIKGKALASLPTGLEKLDLAGCRLLGSLEPLGRLGELRELNLQGTGLKPATSSTLAKLSKLEILSLPHDGDLDRWLGGLESLRHIREINIQDFTLTENTGYLLSNFRNLDKLNLSGKSIPNSIFQAIGRFEHLKYLNLSQTNVEDASPIQWEKLQELKELYLGYTSVGNYTLARLEKLPVEKLGLQWCKKISPGGLSSISRLPELISLDLSAVPNIGCVFQFLNSEKIESLELAATQLDDAQLTHVTRLENLSNLDIQCNPGISKKSINTLLALKRLKHLDIYKTGLHFSEWHLLQRSLTGCCVSWLKF